MAGGLIQLAIYGSQDIFITGSPQITFFKIVYRRHTNFATESIGQDFLGEINFGLESSCVIDKLGDLMGRIYLEIELPKVDLAKNPGNLKTTKEIAEKEFSHIKQYYDMICAYISVNTDILRKIEILVKTNNICMTDIENIVNSINFIGDLSKLREGLQQYISLNNNFNEINELREKKIYLIQQINRIDAQKIFNAIIKKIDSYSKTIFSEMSDIMKKQEVLSMVHWIYSEIKDFYMSAYNLFIEKQNTYKSILDGTYQEKYKFAWVEEIGHAIIEKIEIQIGGNNIDQHTGDWLIIYNKLFLRNAQTENYYKMVGNIPELTVYDDATKNSYKLIIPFQFWFCRNTGLALPLIALRYHDIIINLCLKNLSQVCYYEDDPNLINMDIVQSQYNINIKGAKLYVDYFFLDTDERRRFAQSTHEYLIETIQYNEPEDLVGKEQKVHLNFSHPTKFIVWFVQPNQYRNNPTGHNKCQWNNFGINNDKTGYPIEFAGIKINNYDRTDPHQDIKFYNYVQPYLYFEKCPTDGLNIYSFAIKPMEHQPSSALNLSRIDDFSLVFTFTPEFLDLVGSNILDGVQNGVYMGAYVMSYNILRIMGGMAGIAFKNIF